MTFHFQPAVCFKLLFETSLYLHIFICCYEGTVFTRKVLRWCVVKHPIYLSSY